MRANLVAIRPRPTKFRGFKLITRKLFIISFIVPLLSSFSPTGGAAEAADDFRDRQIVIAKRVSARIETRFTNFRRTMIHLGATLSRTSLTEKRLEQEASPYWDVLHTMGSVELIIVDTQGRILFAGADKSLISRFRADTVRFSEPTVEIENHHDFRLLGVNLTQSDKNSLVAAVLPILTADSKKGKVIGIIDVQAMADDVVSLVALEQTVGAFLFDHRLALVGNRTAPQFEALYGADAAPFPFSDKLQFQMKAGNSGICTFEYTSEPSTDASRPEHGEIYWIAYAPFRLDSMQFTLGIWRPYVPVTSPGPEGYTLNWRSAFIWAIILAGTGMVLAALRHRKLWNIAARKARDRHQRLLTILDNMDAAIYVVDIINDRILYANRQAHERYGRVEDKPCHEVFAHLAQTGCDPCRPIEKQKNVKTETACSQIYRDSTRPRWFQSQSQMIQWLDGRDVRLEIVTDVTRRKQAEQQLETAHKQTTTFCRVIRHMGALRSLDELSVYLMAELTGILNNPQLVLYVFTEDKRTLYQISNNGAKPFEAPDIIKSARECLADAKGLTVGTQRPFRPPLLPSGFPVKGRQTVIGFNDPPYFHGALMTVCNQAEQCDSHQLKLVEVVLEQAAGNIKRIVNQSYEARRLVDQINEREQFCGIIGKDPRMQIIYKLIADTAPSNAGVLIQGESGTGKELVAKAIHQQSNRRHNALVVINCSAYPDTLLESELFGHEKGAFSGATRRKPGRFELADGGTVFLDEIGEIPPAAQIKLLRVLQTQKFERVGGEETLSVDIRILAATNRDLIAEVKEGRFREDLYYRLNVIPIHLPPLRERPGDISLLAKHFVRQFSQDHDADPSVISGRAMQCIRTYHWPGNVRELENSIEHAVVLAKGAGIDVSHLPEAVAQSNKAQYRSRSGSMVEIERRLLQDTLAVCRWNKSKAARQLGISRSTLYQKIKRYRLKPSTGGQASG